MPKKRPIKIEVWRAVRDAWIIVDGNSVQKHRIGNWYWHARSPNGNIMADGSEGYERRATMTRSIRRLFPDAEVFPIVEKS